MDCWNFLKIDPTKDTKEIKRAYSKLLKKYRPEQDNEGFMRLREAYEEALSWARAEQENAPKTPVDLWIEQVDAVYRNFKDRVNVDKWKALLEEPVCVAIDSAAECNERLLIYLADHILVPHEVLHELEAYFHWNSRREQLCEDFPDNYIDYLCGNAKYPDNFRYTLLDPDLDMDYDAFLEDYYKLERELQTGDSQSIREAWESLCQYKVVHPDLVVAEIRVALELDETDCVEALCRRLEEMEPGTERTESFLARCYLELEQYEKAIQYYDRLLARKPNQVGSMLGKTTCLKECGRYDEALALAKKAQEEKPYDAYVRNYMVVLNEEMIEERKRCYKAAPDDNRLAYEYCLVLAEAYHFEEAEHMLQMVTRENVTEKEYCELCVKVYMDIGNSNCEKAIPYLTRLIEMEPDNSNYYEDLGYCYGEIQQLEKAKAIYAKAKQINKESPRVYYRLAQIYIKEKRYDEAVRVCDEGLAYDDQIPNLYHFKAEACYYLRDYARALELCDRSILILPYVDTYEIKMRILNDCEQFEQVEEFLGDKMDSDFMSDMLYAQLAKAKRRLGKEEEAVRILDARIQENSREPEVYYQRGILYFSRDDGTEPEYGKAAEMAHRAMELDREFVFEHVLLEGQSWIHMEQLEKAMECYEACVQKGCREETLFLAIGDLYFEMDQMEKAIEAYQRALAENPDSEIAHGRLGDAYMENRNYRKALSEIKQQLELEPSDYHYINCGIIYGRLGSHEMAKKSYRLALEDNPKNCYAWNNLGYALQDTGLFAEALDAFDKANECGYPYAENYYEAARLCRRLGEYERGIRYLKKLFDLGEKSYPSMQLLAQMYEQLQQWDLCEEVYREMKQNYPDESLRILENWADVYKHRGDDNGMRMIWKKQATLRERQSFTFFRYMAGYYLDYCDDVNKALKYYKKADELQSDGYVASRLGVLYEKLGRQKKAQQAYERSLMLDTKAVDPKNPCTCDCIGMDYAWLGQFDQAVYFFYRAIRYGARCRHCSMAECYEVYYDIGDAMERKACAIRTGNRIQEEEKHLDWVRTTWKYLEDLSADKDSYTPEAFEQEFGYVPPDSIFAEMRQLLQEYLRAQDERGCLAMAYAYYRKALALQPQKRKYQKAVERLGALVKEM